MNISFKNKKNTKAWPYRVSKLARIGNNSERISSERTQDLGNVTLEADERLNQLNFQWQNDKVWHG